MSKIKNNFSFFLSIMLQSLFASVSFVFVFFVAVLPYLERQVTHDKKDMVKTSVDSVFGVLTHYAELEKSGVLSRDQAQRQAKEQVSKLRHHGDNYFWINDTHPRMVMHPIKPSLDGSDLSDFEDPNKVKLFVEMVEATKGESGSGFVDYFWPKPGAEEPILKTSYVRLFSDWGWIIGTGVYMDDVQAQVSKATKDLGLWYLWAALFALLVSAFFAWKQIVKVLEPISSAIAQLSTASEGLGETSESLQKQSSQMLHSISEQSDNVLKMSSASTQMNEMIGRSKTNASSARESAAKTEELSRSCVESVDQVSSNVDALVDSVDQILKKQDDGNEKLHGLVTKMEEISQKTKLIEEIVFQTKLLSFNASVEAARAGEHGKGFSVVAEEIGNLAINSGKSAQMIASIVEESLNMVYGISEEIKKSSELSSARSRECSDDVEKALNDCRGYLDDVLEKAKSASSMVGDISHALEEQAIGSASVTESATSLEKINDANKEQNRSLNVASESLATRVDELALVVEDRKAIIKSKDRKSTAKKKEASQDNASSSDLDVDSKRRAA